MFALLIEKIDSIFHFYAILICPVRLHKSMLNQWISEDNNME